MELYRPKPAGGAHSVALAGLGAIALVLVINVGSGKVPARNPVSAFQLPGPQLLTPSPIDTAEASVNDLEPRLPRDERSKQPSEEESKPKVNLSRDQIWEVQAWLKAFALDPGPIDGIPGPKTFAAVRKFESAHRRPETGNINYVLLGALRLESGLPLR